MKKEYSKPKTRPIKVNFYLMQIYSMWIGGEDGTPTMGDDGEGEYTGFCWNDVN